ncbi:MAG TPA: hypothetical protein VF771_13485 [Longimicrobiaceae bacterium]
MKRLLPTILLASVACSPAPDRRTPEKQSAERRISHTAASPMKEWPFADPETVATFTTRQVTRGGEPILAVFHDAEDGSWQFTTGAALKMDDMMIVSLREVFDLDPSIAEVADLPLGWEASRTAPGEPWQRRASE